MAWALLCACFILVDKTGDKNCQTAYKPGSVRPCNCKCRSGTTIPLGRASLRASRDQPGRRGGNAPASRVRLSPSTPPVTPIRSCSRWGLPCRPCCQGRGALLPHRFTLALAHVCPKGAHESQAVCFLWHFPWGRPRRPLTGTVFPWSPDFPLLRGLAPERNSGRPAVWRRQVGRPRRTTQVWPAQEWSA